MKLTTKALVITLFLPLLTLTGCVTLPTESITQPITPEELSAHVDFLTLPALKGRPARSLESKIARDYLTGRLKQYGCVPWADTATFEQDFGLGTNVIGILPGSDPNLSNEIVLISAHYDHLKSKSFTYYPGAADNAAAVAVLLEIAEKLSQAEQNPKRSICFAFFDAEEKGCLGSFAFTSR
ncbi:MAG: M20/M25/M40 family metallo-hydrolase, partial [Planctomycetota bacterium]